MRARTYYIIYKNEMKWIITYMTLGLLLCTACSDDSDTLEEQKPALTTLTVIPYYSSFFEVNEMPTRALPTGYKPFSELYPTSTPNHTSIGLILTPNHTSVETNTIRYINNKWTGTLDIANEEQYYIYGFMPSEDAAGATVVSKNGTGGPDFANGATLTINGLSTLTPADVCVVVGVKKSDTPTNISELADFKLGQFGYWGSSTDNYVFLLLKHLYAGLHFKAHIDTEYAKLREIRVKEMKLKTTEEIATRINLTVPLTANNTGADPVGTLSYADDSNTTGYAEITLFPYEGGPEEYSLPVETPQNFLSCFAPGKCKKFMIITKYDVYDRKGNKIREDCIAENQINTAGYYGIDDLEAGDIYTIDLKVQPTYLYVLSEPDLDNPTFVIE